MPFHPPEIGGIYTLFVTSLALLLSLAASQVTFAQPASQPASSLHVYLITMGPGGQVYERFGHNALWISDPQRNLNAACNYGVFDFEQHNFILRFIRGTMLYRMEGWDAARTLEVYIAHNRSVWVQELNLTEPQKLALVEFLTWNARPENSFYPYDYYQNNCSTKVRDALDRVLGGQLKRQFQAMAVPATYRQHTRRMASYSPFMRTALDFALGQPTDRPLTAWEESFLPGQLQKHLRSVQVLNDQGQLVPLVKSEQQLSQSTEPAPPDAAPGWLIQYLLLGLFLGGGLALLGHFAPSCRWLRRGFAVVGGLWGLLAGLGGVFLGGIWLFTAHQAAYYNENLLQFSPLALPMVVLLPALAWGKPWSRRLARVLALALAASAVLGLLLKVLPWFDQTNGNLIALALPVNLALAWGVWRLTATQAPANTARPEEGRRQKAPTQETKGS